MNTTNRQLVLDTSFIAPTSLQVRNYLRRHGLREPSGWLTWGPIAALVGLLMLSLMSANPVTAFLPWVGAGAIVFGLSARVNHVRRLGQRVARSQELAVLRQWPVSLRMCWRLLPSVAGLPGLHSRVVAVMATCLDQVKAYEAAVEAYGYLLDQLPPDQPGTVQLRIHYAIALVLDGRLADADDTLQRLRGAVDSFPGTTISGSYRLARLAQQSRTHHWEEAVESSVDTRETLCPLGIDAGFGYGLLALAYQHMANRGDRRAARQCRLWWLRATTLVPRGGSDRPFPGACRSGREGGPVGEDD